MGFLKPKAAKSTSENTNKAAITSAMTPAMQSGNQATNFLAQMLGVAPSAVSSTTGTIGNVANGIAQAGGAQAGYQGYLQQAGFAPAMRQLAQGITGQGAASGLLNSGATAKALQSRGADLNNQYYNNYMQQLAGLAGLGQNAAGMIANVGQKSTSNGGGPSTAGTIASTVGSLASIFSDRRLKADIQKIDELPDGLGVYSYRYKTTLKKIVGVMADEVAKLRPWALGPEVSGYQTVNYGAL